MTQLIFVRHMIKRKIYSLLVIVILVLPNLFIINKSTLIGASGNFKKYSLFKQNESLEIVTDTIPVLWKFNTTGTITSSPAIGDLNNDSFLDIVFGSGDSILYAVNGKDGTLLWRFQTGGVIDSSPALGDLNNDGVLDVIIDDVGLDEKSLCAINGLNGSILWKHKIENGLDYSSPAISDLDGDDKLEVAFGICGRDPNFFVLNGEDGSVLWTFSAKNALLGTSPAVGDLNGDSRLNLVFQSIYQPKFITTIYMLDGINGSLLWSRNFTQVIHMSSPSLYDINKDNKLDVLIGSGDDHMYALNGEDGSILWRYKTPGDIWSSLALGDVDLDGQVEVVFGSTHGQKVYALNGQDGSLRWTYNTPGAGGYSSPALGDIDGDGKLEVVVGRWDGKIHVINAEDGTGLWTYQTYSGVVSSPALGDVDGDNDLEIVIGSEDGFLYVLNPSPAGQRVYWQGYGGTMNFDRTRNLLNVDRDQDFLSDYSEGLYGTNPSDSDSDNDSIPDGWEVSYLLNPLDPSDAINDTDEDGLSNYEEYKLTLDPTDPDVDNDGALDGEEVGRYLLDPKNFWFNPLTRLIIVMVILCVVLSVPLVMCAILFFYRDKWSTKNS